MNTQKSGFVMIDALVSFMMVVIIVSLLVQTAAQRNRLDLWRQKQQQKQQAIELEWWHLSKSGCRDTCLIDALLYPLS